MMRRNFNLLLISVSVALFSGCQGLNPVTDTGVFFIQSKLNDDKSSFVPGFEYLEIEWRGSKTALALGYRETQGSQVIEHWYSRQGEMLKLVNGRITQAIGMTKEIRNTSSQMPGWAEVLSHRLPLVWSQTKDTMPGYRYGLQEFVSSHQMTPSRTEAAYFGESAKWVYEEVKSKKPSVHSWLYKQKFAIQNNQVIYSEQCVAYGICFKLKPLGVVVGK